VTNDDLVLSATIVALYCCCDTVSLKPLLERAPPLTKAYSSAKPSTASLKLNTTLAPYVTLESLVVLSVKYCSLRPLRRNLLAVAVVVDTVVCARVVLIFPVFLMMANVGGVMS